MSDALPETALARITFLTRTCGACPSQWEGCTDDGRQVYIRYRHGLGQVGFGNTPKDAVEATFSDETAAFRWDGEDEGGYLTDEGMRDVLTDNGITFADGLIPTGQDVWA